MLYIVYQDYNITNELMNTLKSHYSNIRFITISNWYPNFNIVKRIILKFSKIFSLKFTYKFIVNKSIQNALKEIKDGDQILFWDYIINFSDIKYFSRVFNISISSIHIWLWNTVDYYDKVIINQLICNNLSLYTFDSEDSRKYNLTLLNQTCCIKNINNKELNFDFFFIGLDKGRGKLLSELEKILTLKGYICKFVILKDSDKKSEYYENLEYIDKELSYDEMLNLLLQTKIVIDITKAGQTGLTLRVLEALFYKKKLITNNAFITQYQFYKPENILILDQEFKFLQYVDDFIDSPLKAYDDKILYEYNIVKWISNFMI